DYSDILKRDKTNLDIFWLKDESLDDLDKLPEPSVLATELIEELGNALEQLKEIQEDLAK
ncbi:MAG: SAM-dependent DNA methyltransferase, partial [Nanoarchaeota archaeon]